MLLDPILNSMDKNSEKIAIYYNEEGFSNKWLLKRMEYWNEKLVQNNVPDSSIFSVRSDFTPDSIGLLLAVLRKNCIYVPISPSVIDVRRSYDIAQVEYYVDLVESEEVHNRNIEVGHKLLCDQIKTSNPGLVLFSSGTTGEPKAAVHDMAPLLGKYSNSGKSLTTITFLLFDHIGGINTLLYTLAYGGTIVALQSRKPEEVCRLINKYNVDLLPASPTFLNMILFSKAYQLYDISCLKIVSYGTEAMPKSTLEAFNNILPKVRMKQTYGLSELGIMSSKSESSNSLWIKVGGKEFETKIVDGQLWIKSKMAMKGYLNAPSPFTDDGWYNTKDRVEQKGEYIRFLGRDSDIINVGGEKVYPAEVESVLLECELVKDASVKGVPHPLTGNIVVATIAIDDNENIENIIPTIKKHCRLKLEKYKVPVKIYISDNSFETDRFKRNR
jgi:acyl-CoA synthetase (AMP-forming)/AMP-acid ligase II